jgi:murein DD-endopeptidase MepM/ murein hydrolase activator NlpD
MLFKIMKRLGVFVAALAVGFTPFSPALPVQAHGEVSPPFELRFPQETVKTSFSDDWGALRSGGRRHIGTDLMADTKMTEVYAIADGVVVKVNESPRAGRYLIIEHAEGWDSYYIHLNNDGLDDDSGDGPWTLTLAPGVEEGASVEAGQLIGWAGDSGNAESNSPHTHFELRFNGEPLNPYPYLEAAFERDHADLLQRLQALLSHIDGLSQIN